MKIDRRTFLRGTLLFSGGTASGLAVPTVLRRLRSDRLPIEGGFAPGGTPATWSPRGHVSVHWHVPTDKPLVALTFDDGPAPDWTPTVLQALDRAEAPATFFVVGQRLRRHAGLLRGRLDRHELGNHTWSHRDLATLDQAGVRDQLARAHETIQQVTGRPPTLLRPPWGHLGGSTLVVADEFGYHVVMWSQKARERHFADDPPGQVCEITKQAQPGSIILAHDVGDESRLVAIRQLDAIIVGLRSRGLRLVTVSELLAAAEAPVRTPQP
jgi:peptidoglycan/xylan/chitin deacetylase (PgdA/CDA1 family)